MSRAQPELLDRSRYVFVHELQTRFADVDAYHHINDVAIAAGFEDARVRFDSLTGVRARYEVVRVMVVAAHIDYLAEAHYPAAMAIHIAVLKIGRTSWTIGQLAVQEGRPRAFCRATMCATDGQRPMVLSEGLRQSLIAQMIRPAR